MTVETVTYISDLDRAYPAESEVGTLHEGNDHIRNIKKALTNTFPNVTGAVTATHTELNILDGVTASTAELNILDGVTASTAELNILDGVTATAAELNVLDGIPGTLTATEIGYLDGVTSSIQDQIDALSGVTSGLPFGIQFNLDTGSDNTFTLDQYASFAYTIVSAVYQTDSGTITANVKIDGTSVTGLSALSLTDTEAGPTNASAANAVAVGNTVSVTLSSNSSAEMVSLKLNCTRG